jgi:hypothetical protein
MVNGEKIIWLLLIRHLPGIGGDTFSVAVVAPPSLLDENLTFFARA